MRTPPVGVSQRPYEAWRAEEYAMHFDPDLFGIPIVNLRDHIYWILDGQHRIGALRLWFGDSDPGSVECEVYEGLTDAEMANIFLGRDARKAVPTFHKFFIACTAEYPRECDIRRTVEGNHLKVSKANQEGCIGAVGALGKVYDRSGPIVLGQVLRVIRDSWGGDPTSFDKDLMVGLGMVFNRYNGRADERVLTERLTVVTHGVRGLLQRAEAQRERTGNQKAQCIAAAIVDVYNRGEKGPRKLPSWWKAAPEES